MILGYAFIVLAIGVALIIIGLCTDVLADFKYSEGTRIGFPPVSAIGVCLLALSLFIFLIALGIHAMMTGR
jgi:hypothetical protein